MKFEYSDFYKFIASLGIALISLAVLVPWLFLREPFDLFVKRADILSLTPLAQAVIQNRQILTQNILSIVPWFSIGTFILGVAVFVVGGRMWLNKTQKVLDKINDLNVRILENQLTPKTLQESKAEREGEAKAILDDETNQTVTPSSEILEPDNVKNFAEDIDRIQRRLTGLLVSCFSDSYSILTERRVGPVSLDIVLLAKQNSYKDIIFEVKYIREGFKHNWLRDNVEKNIYASQIYNNETNRPAISVLFIVNLGEIPTATTKYLESLRKELSLLSDNKAQVVILTELDFYNMDCRKLKTLFTL